MYVIQKFQFLSLCVIEILFLHRWPGLVEIFLPDANSNRKYENIGFFGGQIISLGRNVFLLYLVKITLLNKLDLLCYANDDISDRKLICKISYHFAFNLARSINIKLEDYLAHDSGNKNIRQIQ